MVIHEGAQKILAFANCSVSCAPWQLDRFHLGFSGSPFHLHDFLVWCEIRRTTASSRGGGDDLQPIKSLKTNTKVFLYARAFGLFLVYTGYAMYRTIPFYDYAEQGRDTRHGWRRLLHIADDELGFASLPGAVGTEATRLGPDVPVRYSPRGFRIPVDSMPRTLPFKRPLIITLGDSFTFGAYSRAKETFPSLLADRLDGTTLNAGFSSYGLAHMEILAQRLIPRYKPDWVVVQFSPWLADRSQQILASSRGFIPSPYYYVDKDGNTELQKPLFRWFNWYKSLQDEGHLSADQKTLKIGFLSFFLKVGLPYFAYADYHLWKARLEMKTGITAAPTGDDTAVNREAYRNIMKTTVDHSAKMVVVRLSRYSNDHEQWENLKQSFKDSPILFLDAESVLMKKVGDNQEEYFKQYAFWYGSPPEMVDAHPNPEAHRIIADTVATAILGSSQTNE